MPLLQQAINRCAQPKTAKVKLSFPYKVWLTTVLLSPIVIITGFVVYNSAQLTEIAEAYRMILPMIFFGLGLSLPALYLFRLLYKELNDSPVKPLYKKGIFAIVGISFISITFVFFDRDFFQDAGLYELWWPSAYSIVLTLSTIFYKMKEEADHEFQPNLIWNVSKWLLFGAMVFALTGCPFSEVGTRPIKRYEFTTCKYTLDSVIQTLAKNSTIRIIDSTGYMSRIYGVFDIIISTNGATNIYKMFYVGHPDYWNTHKENCSMSIREINNKSKHDFGRFSSEKRRAIEDLETHLISKLKDLPSCTMSNLPNAAIPCKGDSLEYAILEKLKLQSVDTVITALYDFDNGRVDHLQHSIFWKKNGIGWLRTFKGSDNISSDTTVRVNLNEIYAYINATKFKSIEEPIQTENTMFFNTGYFISAFFSARQLDVNVRDYQRSKNWGNEKALSDSRVVLTNMIDAVIKESTSANRTFVK